MMYEIPTTLTVNSISRTIRNQGDYRMVLDCFTALNDIELSKSERILATLMIFYDDFDSLEDLCNLEDAEIDALTKEMFKFFNCGQEESPGAVTSTVLVDWEKDAPLIFSAINNVACKEVRSEPYLHWWTFMGFYIAIGESAFSTVVSIRDKITKGKKLEKYENEFRRNNPGYFVWDNKTTQQKEDDALMMQLWHQE